MPLPWPDMKKATRAKELSAAGVSMRDIGYILRNKRTGKPADVKTVARWLSYVKIRVVGKLSTDKVK